jgi:TolB-like protein/Flp pilus assembly protein TadD/predicted Ser/Thr protein kinase
MIGKTLGRYDIVDEIGEGGIAVVYRAVDTRLRRSVALKFLKPHAMGEYKDRERFMREARAAAALDHPNICAVYESDEQDGNVFIAMPFIEGKTLKELIAGQPMPFDRIVPILEGVARGLEAAHRRGIVHRDVSSNNIMVTDDGLAKITDFGLATLPGPHTVSKTPVFDGTPSYMSPEQARGEETDARTDIWSLGVCLYEMLTGRLPFPGEYPAAIAYLIEHESPAPVGELRPDAPEPLRRIVDKALSKDPAERYQNASELLTELSALADSLHLAAVGVREGEAKRRSIAVLPFADLSPGQDQSYFCDGIAEEVINALVRIDDLDVVARTSSFMFKGKTGDIREIGRQLHVDTVLEGSLRKAKNRVRITVQLVNVVDGFHIWSRQYDRELEDILEIQTEIAGEIANALELTPSEREKRALEKLGTSVVKAYDFYLRGREYFYKSKRRGIESAIQMFTRAIREDPRYAMAYAGMADCHSYLYMYFGRDPANLDGAEAASGKAVELGPDLAEARAARGLAFSLRRRWAEAEEQFEEAIRLNPNLFEAYYFFARTCFTQGKNEMAAELYRSACRVSPHDYQAPSLLAFTYNSLGEFEKSKAAYRMSLVNIERRLETHPDDSRAINLGALSLASLGERDLAIEWGKRSAEFAPDDPYILYGVACIYGRLGVVEEGLDYFGKAVSAGFAHKDWIEHDDDLDAFRSHPLFQALVDKLK